MTRSAGIACERGQSTVEWSGLVCLCSVLLVAVVSAVPGDAGLGAAHAVRTKLLCAVSLAEGCARAPSLEAAYGPRLAMLVREHAPELRYGPDMLGLPVDYRTCRSAYCAEGTNQGDQEDSTAGEEVTLFTRVLQKDGSRYLQYWAYYPESASLRGAPLLEDQGYHAHDWESFQVRVGPNGEVDERASSHAGYNHTRSRTNWLSDSRNGIGPIDTDLPGEIAKLLEEVGIREENGWDDARGTYLIAGGSHAGNVEDEGGDYPSWTSRVRLVPLEEVKGDGDSRPADFGEITPPWKKEVWTSPEAPGTG